MTVNIDFPKFLYEVETWQKRNFPNASPYQPLLGALEELGELAHAHLKMDQNIRGTFIQHFNAKKDAVGDVIIYLIHYCLLNGFQITDAMDEAWSIVRQRNWQENPLTGRTESEEQKLTFGPILPPVVGLPPTMTYPFTHQTLCQTPLGPLGVKMEGTPCDKDGFTLPKSSVLPLTVDETLC